jgi:dTDP-glucose 4,6-dehydratase
MADVPDGYSLFRADLEHMASEARGIWHDLSGASILITGGTGFFGMWLAEGLLWANAALGLGLTVTLLSRDGAAFLAGRGSHLRGHGALGVISGDVASFDPGARRFTHIVHAAVAAPHGHVAQHHIETALAGTARIVRLAADHGCEAVLLTSSGAVYRHPDPPAAGRDVEGPSGRQDYTGFRPAYAEAKRMAETMLAAGGEQYGFRCAIARCFAFAGAYLPLDGGLALGNFIRDALTGRDIVVAGDGTPLRSYLYAADLVVWLMTILTRGEDCRPYNVGGADTVSIAGLAREVAAAAGGGTQVIVQGRLAPGAAPDVYLPDLRRATAELGLRAAIDLPDAIRRTLAWYRARPA